MKALLLSEIFPPTVGGSGAWFREIYGRLSSTEVALLVGQHESAATYDRTHDLDLARAPLSSTSWSLLDVAGLTYYVRSLLRLREQEKASGASIVHCGRVMPEGVIALMNFALSRTPYICFVHGEDIALANESRESKAVVKRVLRHADGLICNSENSASLLSRDWGIFGDRVKVMHPGIDTTRFSPAKCRSDLRDSLGWCGRKVILTVSRLEQRKGHSRLIESLPAVLESEPSTLYVIVGDGGERSRLEGKVERLGLQDAVQFRGECDDDEALNCYRGCDLFCLPNRTVGSSIEGFGIVLLEAQACGSPVIAGDSGGTRETMLVGTTGLIVDCTTTEPLTKALIDLLGDDALRMQMGQAARQYMRDQFDWDARSRMARSVFNEFLGS